jgi:hypothetical protein
MKVHKYQGFMASMQNVSGDIMCRFGKNSAPYSTIYRFQLWLTSVFFVCTEDLGQILRERTKRDLVL